ncbi:MAG: gamma-glutamyltransferase, partial [Rhodospirillales bacterium]|nr:gamma-glutamyltransferase [Rhodospirillales bacterium]
GRDRVRFALHQPEHVGPAGGGGEIAGSTSKDPHGSISIVIGVVGLFFAWLLASKRGRALTDRWRARRPRPSSSVPTAAPPGRPNMFGLVQGEANAIAPGKRPLSSMTPTIVLRDGHLVAVLGSPGGSRIITTVLETILNLVDHGMAPQEAVDAPRLHDQGQPDVLFAEPRALSPDTRQRLEAMGYHIRINPPWGAVALVAVGQAQAPAAMQAIPDSAASGATRPRLLYGAMDSRRPAGAAIGR